jgi:ribosomal protein S18 acetylase RimI-like enzyme
LSGPAVEIVRATEADIPFMMATERLPGNEELVGRWEREEHEQAVADDSNAYFIGSVGTTPIGFVIVQHWASAKRATLIRRIIVADVGRKLGRELLSGVIDVIFAETDAAWLWLNVHPHNERAQRAYSAIGFQFAQRAVVFPEAGESKSLLMTLQRSDWRRPRASSSQ